MDLNEAFIELNKNGYLIKEANKTVTIGDYDVELSSKGKQKYDYIKANTNQEDFDFYANVIAAAVDDVEENKRLYLDNNNVFWKVFWNSKQVIKDMLYNLKIKKVVLDDYTSHTDESIEKKIEDKKNNIDKKIAEYNRYYGPETAKEYKEIAYRVFQEWSKLYKQSFEEYMKAEINEVKNEVIAVEKYKDIYKKIYEEFKSMEIDGGKMSIVVNGLISLERINNQSIVKRLPKELIEKINSLKDGYYVNYIEIHYGSGVRGSSYKPFVKSDKTENGVLYEIDKFMMYDYDSDEDKHHKLPTQKETFPKLANWFGKKFDAKGLYELLSYINSLDDKQKSLIVNWQTWYDKNVRGTTSDPSWRGPNGTWSLD